MLLKKTYYDDLKKLLEDGERCAYSDGELGSGNNELLYEVMRCYERKDGENLGRYLQNGTRYRRLFEKFMAKVEKEKYVKISYAVGEFTGIMKALEKLVIYLSGKEKNRKTLTGLCVSRRYVKQILLQIYQSPDIRHNELADKVGIAANYLSELMKLLEPTGSIDRYAYGRNTYYELTLDGQQFVEENLRESNHDNGEFYLFNNGKISGESWKGSMAIGKLQVFPADKILNEDRMRVPKGRIGFANKPKNKMSDMNKLIPIRKLYDNKMVGRLG